MLFFGCTVMMCFEILMMCCDVMQYFNLFSVLKGAESPRSSTEPLPMAVAKEAKVSDMEDDQLEEEDLLFIDSQ